MGRGLRALIAADPVSEGEEVTSLPVASLRASRVQPRLRVDESPLEPLAASIRTYGILQPLVVRRASEGYEIVAGERRWRAAKLVGLDRVPVKVVEAESDGKALEIALVENVQREDLDPISRARAIRRLVEVFSLTQDQVAERVGFERSTITNLLRLLDLPQSVQDMVSRGTITAGHARALLSLDRPDEIERAAERVRRESLTVRATEALARGHRPVAPRTAPKPTPAWAAELEARLVEALGARVRLERRSKGWRIGVDCASDEELGRVSDRILGRAPVGS
jgi:ParB family chromosome partitioning protein